MLLHSPGDHSDQCWSAQSQESASSHVSHVGGKGPALGLSFVLLQAHEQAAGGERSTGTPRRCWRLS